MNTPEWLRSEEVDETGRQRVNWWRALALFIGAIGVVMFMVYLIQSYKTKEEISPIEKADAKMEQPYINFDEEIETEEVAVETAREDQTEKEEESREPDPRIEILARLGQERITPFQMDHKRVAEFREFAGSSGGLGGCDILPGVTAKIRLNSGINTDGGGVATGTLVEPVPGQDGCIALDSGATFTGLVDTNVGFGQGRGNVVFTSITTPDGRVFNIDAQAGDAVGVGGIPGRVNRHLGSKIAAVAIATGVDLAKFAVAGNGGYGIIVGNSGSVMDDFARQLLGRKNTITVDPNEQTGLITVTFTQKISM